MVGVVAADLISGLLECVLYGIFSVLSATSLVLLIHRHREAYVMPAGVSVRRSCFRTWLTSAWGLRRSPFIVANIILILTITAHCVISAHRLLLAIVYHDGETGAADFISNLGETTQVIRLVLLFIDMFIGDLVITYRVWLVWGRCREAIMLPTITTVALLATGIGLIRQFVVSKPNGSIFDPEVSRWITAYCIMTFCTNIYGTVVIAYRIWVSNRQLRSTGLEDSGRSLLEAMAIFVESAALYTGWGVFFVTVYGTKSHLQIIGTGCAPVVLGVTFMLITVRVGLGWAQESKGSSCSSSIQWAAPRRSRSSHRNSDHAIPLQTLTLNRTVQRIDEATEGSTPSVVEKSGPKSALAEET